MSSNKNLKVYRIQFITEVKDMVFKVKFPCQVKMVWKRSNQTAQTSLVPVKDGIVSFNQTLKLYVNMYYDTTTSKFVEKKCMYSFLICTEKGEKSAGNITYDLSQFFNKRVYEIQEEFSLQKCPLADTKIKMKIYYEESSEQGYDSMSQISAVGQPMDTSTVSVDFSELNNSEIKTENTSLLEKQKEKKEQESLKQSTNYDLLNEEDLGSNKNLDKLSQPDSTDTKISSSNEQINALSQLTGKINDFVFKCSGNIKSEVESLKHKMKMIQQELQGEKINKQKIEKQKQEESRKLLGLEKEYQNYKEETELKLKHENQQIQELQSKLKQSQGLCSQLESNMSEKGEAETSYIAELKLNFEKDEQKLKTTIKQTQQQLLEQKKMKNQLTENNKHLERQLAEMRDKLSQEMERNKSLQGREKQRERELEEVRMKMEDAYENMVASLGSVLQ